MNERKEKEKEMGKPKLVFKLETVGDGCTLMFYIKEMDERFRTERNQKSKTYQSKPGSFKITSVSGPAFGPKQLYLRGKQPTRDNSVTTKKFNSPQDAERYRRKILEALNDWAENWKGFEESEVSVDGEYLTV